MMGSIIKVLFIMITFGRFFVATASESPPPCTHLFYEMGQFSSVTEVPRPFNSHCLLIIGADSITLMTGFGRVKGIDCAPTKQGQYICLCSECTALDLLKEAQKEKYIRHVAEFLINHNLPTPLPTDDMFARVRIFCLNAVLAAGTASLFYSIPVFFVTTLPSLNEADRTFGASSAFSHLAFSLAALLLGQLTEVKVDRTTKKLDRGDLAGAAATTFACAGCVLSVKLIGYSNMANSVNAVSASLGLVVFVYNAFKNSTEVAKMQKTRSVHNKVLFGEAPLASLEDLSRRSSSIDPNILTDVKTKTG